MKKPSINFTKTKEEQARRRAQAKGNAYTQTKDCAKRWERQARELEAEAWKEYGVRVEYSRAQNCRMYR